MALSLSLMALGGCQNPGASPAGIGGNTMSELPAATGAGLQQEARQFVANPVDLKFTGATATVNQAAAASSIDGNLSSCWDSGNNNTNPSVTFPLAELTELTELTIKVNPNVGTYDVELSADGSSWTKALTGQKNSGWNPETKKLPAGMNGKFVRLSFANAGKKVMLFEVSAKGGAATTTTPTTAPTTAPAPVTDKVTAAASHTNGSYAAARAIDGDTNTEWQSGAVSNPTLTVTLPGAFELSELAIKTNPGAGTYAVETSLDGATWTAALSNQSNSGWGVETKKLPAGIKGQHLRLKFANGGKNVMVFEATVKTGAAVSAPAPTTAPTTAPTAAPTTAPAVSGTTASHTSGSFAASRAFDGDVNTEWQSGAVSNPWLVVDRGSATALTSLGIKTNPGFGTYSVEVSDDGVNFKQVLANQSNSTWGVENKAVPSGTSGRFIRLKFANSSKNVMVFEVQAAGGTSTSPTTAPTVAPTTSPTQAPPTSSGTTIYVNAGQVLHKAQSHILGTNRNHVTGDFPNGAAKLEKLKELRPQWGDRKYLYRIGHGPTDGRNDYSYMTGFHFEQAWGKTAAYPYDDIREGLREANTLGADQIHVINYGTSNEDEAARYVSYLNKAGDANRAKYPFAQQNVREFEIGNEIGWSMVRGHSQYASSEKQYATRALGFAKKMRAASDVPIKIGLNGSINSNWEGEGWSGGATSIKNMMGIMGDQVDFFLFHGYPSWPLYKDGDLSTIMAQNEWSRQKIRNEIKPAIQSMAGGRDVYIANTEFFTHLYNDVTRSRGMFGALYSADTVTLAMNEDIRTAVQFAFEHKDMADASFFIGNDVNNTTAIFKFQKMLAEHWGDQVVATSGQQIPTQNVAGASTSVTLPKLAFTAATSGDKVYVMVTHRMNDADIKSNVNVGFTPKSVTAYELSDPNGWNAANATVKTIANPSLNGYNFKKASVTIFEISK